jgi:hypothetical protein
MIDQEVDAYDPLQRIVEKKEGMCVFRHIDSVPTVALVIMLTSAATIMRLWWYRWHHNPKDLCEKAHNSWQCDNL